MYTVFGGTERYAVYITCLLYGMIYYTHRQNAPRVLASQGLTFARRRRRSKRDGRVDRSAGLSVQLTFVSTTGSIQIVAARKFVRSLSRVCFCVCVE